MNPIKLVEILLGDFSLSDYPVPSAGRHKIKLKGVVYWLIYEVSDKTVTVLVVAVGYFPDAPKGSPQIVPNLQ